MRVSFLDQSGQLGGAELMLQDLIPRLACDSKVVLLQDGPFAEALKAQGLAVSVVSAGSLKATKKAGLVDALRSIPQVIRLTRKVLLEVSTSDVIYANTPKAWIIGAMVSAVSGIPLVCHLHDIVSARHFSALNRWLFVRAANHFSSSVIANSEASKAAFVAAGGNVDLVSVVPNGFDPKAFEAPLGEPSKELRTQLGIGDAPMVAMLGRLAHWKGQHVFIDAISQMPAVHGVIVGEALFTPEDHAYATGLRQQCVEAGCADRVHFVGFKKDVLPIIREADVVAHCSVAPEPFGRVIVEAMLCGRPVVVAAEGGAAEIISDGVTGLLHKPGDASDLTAKLLSLLTNKPESLRIAEAGKASAEERFNLAAVADKTLTILRIIRDRDLRSPWAAHQPSRT